MKQTFDDRYPNISWWCQGRGWIEVGRDEYRSSLIRVQDIGGVLWEGDDEYGSVEKAMDEADEFIAQWREETEYDPS